MLKETRENKFLSLMNIDVGSIIENDFKGLSYISWSNAYALLMSQDPSASFQVHENEDGLPFFEGNGMYFVKTSVTMDGVTKKMVLPVMDNNHNAVKDSAYTIKTKKGEMYVPSIDARHINDSIMRCLVKTIALFGIGLSLYVKNHDGLEAILNMDEAEPVHQEVTKKPAPAAPSKPEEQVPESVPAEDVAQPSTQKETPKGRTTKKETQRVVVVHPEPAPVEYAEDDLSNLLNVILPMKSALKGVKKGQLENRVSSKDPKIRKYEKFTIEHVKDLLKTLDSLPDANTVQQESARLTFS